jgi:hypothetical protein
MSSMRIHTYYNFKYGIYSKTEYKPKSCTGRVRPISDSGGSLFRIGNNYLRNVIHERDRNKVKRMAAP